MKNIQGLHHITAMSSDPQENVDFYAGVLGMRMVKKTINFDAPDIYHLYYGDETGSPGTIMTFFPIPGMRQGSKGTGQATVTSFSIGKNSLEYWMRRLENFGVTYQHPQTRFDDEVFIYFEDRDGLGIELVANAEDKRVGYIDGHVPAEHAIKGFHSVTLATEGYERTAGLLTEQMDHRLIAEKGNRMRFSTAGKPGDYVDILTIQNGQRGMTGSGAVHHIAFATENDQTQDAAREKIVAAGFDATQRIDRQYFHSIYFREPAGILFEVATNDIGFLYDEDIKSLGTALKLPSWQEKNRDVIEAGLQPVDFNIETYID